jgi:demethylmenaquinone methyltransferase/2-methoxy-6-polyprenyl-1,4-benzoquinol methylase
MRWLERSPDRYDLGMRALTLGWVSTLHAGVSEAAVSKPGDRVLEIGCGTGSVTALMLARGAHVTALDQSPEMLERARARLEGKPQASLQWLEQTASEIDRLPEASFEAVVLCLCLSDMSCSERAFVLREAARRLAQGGRLVAADEVQAPRGWRRVVQRVSRIPVAAIGWLLVGTVSRPVPDLAAEIREAGLQIVDETRWLMGTLALITAEPRP